MGVALALLGLVAVASAASTASASAEDVLSQAKAESEALDEAFNTHQPKAVSRTLHGDGRLHLPPGLLPGDTPVRPDQRSRSDRRDHRDVLPAVPLGEAHAHGASGSARHPRCHGVGRGHGDHGAGRGCRTDPRPGRGRPRAGRCDLEDRRGTLHLQGSPAKAVGLPAGIPCRSDGPTITDRQGAGSGRGAGQAGHRISCRSDGLTITDRREQATGRGTGQAGHRPTRSDGPDHPENEYEALSYARFDDADLAERVEISRDEFEAA